MSINLDNMFFISQAAPTTTPTIATTSTAPNTKAPEAAPGIIQLFFPIVLILVLYLFLIRPQQTKEKKRQESIKALQKGDKVVTRGGLIGVITDIDNEKQIVSLKIADKVIVDITNQAIEVINPVFEKEKAK